MQQQLGLCAVLVCLAACGSAATDVGAEAAAPERESHPAQDAPPKSPPFRTFKAFRQKQRAPPRSLVRHPDVAKYGNLVSGVLLLCSGPLALQGSAGDGSALKTALLAFWVSTFGTMLMLQELKLPQVRRWFRRNFRFLATSGGRLLFSLCAATMAIASGPHGRLPAAATLVTGWFSSLTRRKPGRPVTASGRPAAAALRINNVLPTAAATHEAAATGGGEGEEMHPGLDAM